MIYIRLNILMYVLKARLIINRGDFRFRSSLLCSGFVRV